jgi:hypothetical protein
MAQQRSFPFRWVFPPAQFLVCFVILWPIRSFLIGDLLEVFQSYAPAKVGSDRLADRQAVIILPEVTPEQQREYDAATKSADLRMRTPLVLDFPVLVAQLPYVIPARREWVPRGMSPETWRALSWPFAGLIFWWLSGRGLEALQKARRSIVEPRLGWIETAFAAILLCIGAVTVIGALTSTPADRGDLQFMALLAGGWLWGMLASVTVVARFLQWRIVRRSATGQPTAYFPPAKA